MFGEVLKDFRISKNLNQVAFAKKLGISKSVVSVHENGKISSYVSYTEKINKIFGAQLPLCIICRDCKKEVFISDGVDVNTGLCAECEEKRKMRPKRRTKRALLYAALDAEKEGLSYGKYVAGEGKKRKDADNTLAVNAEPLVPTFLELGKTIKI